MHYLADIEFTLTAGDLYNFKVVLAVPPGSTSPIPTFYRQEKTAKPFFSPEGVWTKSSSQNNPWVKLDLIPNRLVIEFFNCISDIDVEDL